MEIVKKPKLSSFASDVFLVYAQPKTSSVFIRAQRREDQRATDLDLQKLLQNHYSKHIAKLYGMKFSKVFFCVIFLAFCNIAMTGEQFIHINQTILDPYT